MDSNNSKLKNDTLTGHDDALVTRFRTLCVRYAALGHEADIEIKPYHATSDTRFKTLPLSHQQGIIQALESSIEICQSAKANGIDIRRQSLSLVWWSLRMAGLRPLSDLFDKLDETDIVEVYNEHDQQIFRSFNMFRSISYTLEELFTHEWWELFERDSAITDLLKDLTQKMHAGQKDTIVVNCPAYVIKERFSEHKIAARIQTKLLSPLFSADGATAGYISCTKFFSIVDQPHSETEHVLSQPISATVLEFKRPVKG